MSEIKKCSITMDDLIQGLNELAESLKTEDLNYYAPKSNRQGSSPNANPRRETRSAEKTQ